MLLVIGMAGTIACLTMEGRLPAKSSPVVILGWSPEVVVVRLASGALQAGNRLTGLLSVFPEGTASRPWAITAEGIRQIANLRAQWSALEPKLTVTAGALAQPLVAISRHSQHSSMTWIQGRRSATLLFRE